jgi:hypothetical protein
MAMTGELAAANSKADTNCIPDAETPLHAAKHRAAQRSRTATQNERIPQKTPREKNGMATSEPRHPKRPVQD